MLITAGIGSLFVRASSPPGRRLAQVTRPRAAAPRPAAKAAKPKRAAASSSRRNRKAASHPRTARRASPRFARRSTRWRRTQLAFRHASYRRDPWDDRFGPGPEEGPDEPEGEGDGEVGEALDRLTMPVEGIHPDTLRDSFAAARSSGRRHRAIDIMAPRGSLVVAAVDGYVRRVSSNSLGGLTVTQIDASGRYSFYYAHLDDYVPGLEEGMWVTRGTPLGYVGTTGNAPENAPHLHFAISVIESKRRWWSGSPVNPYPLLSNLATE